MASRSKASRRSRTSGAKAVRNRDRREGDQVKVLEGPFASFNGLVEELDFARGR
jgi:transcriptional antiterminator NusG